MEVWKFEHCLLIACEPSFWRVNDTWNKRAIKYHYCKEASQKFIQIIVYGCIRHILICIEILMSSFVGIVLCTSKRLKLFYTTICCTVAEWKKKSEKKHESYGDFMASNTSMTHLTWGSKCKEVSLSLIQITGFVQAPFSSMHTPTSLEKKIFNSHLECSV